jgi:flagellar protein FlaH
VGYGITNAIREGRLMVISRFGIIVESRSDVMLQDVLASLAVPSADVVVFDSVSSLMLEDFDEKGRFELVQQMRKVAAEGRSFMLCVDPEEMDQKLLHTLRASAEVVLNLENALIGGEIKRNIIVTRFLRAAGPIQSSIGWRVEPGMGFIVDITAVS